MEEEVDEQKKEREGRRRGGGVVSTIDPKPTSLAVSGSNSVFPRAIF